MGVFYRRGLTLPLLRCLNHEDADYILRQIHGGIYGNHFDARSLKFKALRKGYFWATMHQDARKVTKNCKSCQSFTSFPTQPLKNSFVTTMSSSWPFAQLGINLIGPLPKGWAAATHVIVAVDYFRK